MEAGQGDVVTEGEEGWEDDKVGNDIDLFSDCVFDLFSDCVFWGSVRWAPYR